MENLKKVTVIVGISCSLLYALFFQIGDGLFKYTFNHSEIRVFEALLIRYIINLVIISSNVNWIKNLVRKRKQKGWIFVTWSKRMGNLQSFCWVTSQQPLHCSGFQKLLTNLWRRFRSCDQNAWVKKISTSKRKATRLPDQVCYSIDIGLKVYWGCFPSKLVGKLGWLRALDLNDTFFTEDFFLLGFVCKISICGHLVLVRLVVVCTSNQQMV